PAAPNPARGLPADRAGGPGEGDVPLPRAGLLRYPDRPPSAADPLVQAADGEWPLAGVLARRGTAPASHAEWLRTEPAEADLAKELGRGERVKLHNAEAIWSACRPEPE